MTQNDPYNFRTFMLRGFHGLIAPGLNMPRANGNFLTPENMYEVKGRIAEAPLDYTLGGQGQDGHVAYNQSGRHPFSHITIEKLRESSIRIRRDNLGIVITLEQRSYEAAYQFVPPVSITLGIRGCLSVKEIGLCGDTGSWKQTALKVALFSKRDSEYPMALLRDHGDTIITATCGITSHLTSKHPEWKLVEVSI